MRSSGSSTGPERSVFGMDWIVMGDAGGQVPPLTAFAHVAKAVRDFILSSWEGPIPEIVSGHAPDGSPSRAPHLTVVPLAQVGAAHADGRLMGLAVLLPRRAGEGKKAAFRDDVRRRLACFLASDAPMTLTLAALGAWCIEHRQAPFGLVRDPARYAGPARLWATVTPIVLDRYPKAKLSAEAIVADASRRIGLPRPRHVGLSRLSPIPGVPPSRAVGEARAWTLPLRRDNSRHPVERRLSTHAVIEYADPVCGPVLLGSARFVGLGLCLPIAGGE